MKYDLSNLSAQEPSPVQRARLRDKPSNADRPSTFPAFTIGICIATAIWVGFIYLAVKAATKKDVPHGTDHGQSNRESAQDGDESGELTPAPIEQSSYTEEESENA